MRGVEQRGEVDVEELVAVQRETSPASPAPRRGEPQPAAATERLRLSHRRRSRRRARPAPSRTASSCPRAQATITRVTPARDEPADLVRGQRVARDGDERLRAAPAPPRPCARPCRPRGGSPPSARELGPARPGDACLGRPMPSYAKPAAWVASGSSRFRPSTISGFAIASRTSADASVASSGHSVTTTAASAPRTASSNESQNSTRRRSVGRRDRVPARAPRRPRRAAGRRARGSAPRACRRCSA